MQNAQFLNVKDTIIDFYLAGPGFGECVIIVIGKKIVIGIDCCYGIQQPYNSRLCLLEEIFDQVGDDCHLYWVLTHFHSDHFQSLFNVIQEFGEKFEKIVIPQSYTSADIYYNLQNLQRSKSFLFSQAQESISSKQYEKVRKILESDSVRKKTSRLTGKNTLINEILHAKGRTFSLKTNIYGTFDADMDNLISTETWKFIEDKNNKKINRSVANRGSYIIHLKCGSLEALLLGDAPIDRTLDVLPDKIYNEPVNNFILKVSHHGSRTGTNKELLQRLQPNKVKKHAFITPFDINKLPDKNILELLAKHDYNVAITGQTDKTHNTEQLLSEINFLTDGEIKDFMPIVDSIIHQQFSAFE